MVTSVFTLTFILSHQGRGTLAEYSSLCPIMITQRLRVVTMGQYTGSIYNDTSFTASMKAVTFTGSFLPGRASTPLLTSTP